jgi:4-hydroxy-tetrahydrodipicolinate reductase
MNLNPIAGKPRIVIYGVGQFGTMIARLAAERGLPIVAAFNRAGPKIGQDLGRICGFGRDLGVIVQDAKTGDYGAIDADIGIVTHRDLLSANMDAYRRLMGAGLNIACHGVQSYLPQSNDPVLAAEIEALAQANGVTFTGCGIWDMSRIWSGILNAGPCTELSSIHISSLTDPQGQTNSLAQIRQYCISETVEEFYTRGIDRNPAALAKKTIPEMVLRALGYTIVESAATIEPVVYDVPVPTGYLPEGFFAPGLVMGVRFHCRTITAEGVVGTGLVDQRMFLPGDVEHMYWEAEGTPRNRTRVERLDSAHATVGNLFNRIPDIIAARPGIVPVYEMGPLRSTARIWPRLTA